MKDRSNLKAISVFCVLCICVNILLGQPYYAENEKTDSQSLLEEVAEENDILLETQGDDVYSALEENQQEIVDFATVGDQEDATDSESVGLQETIFFDPAGNQEGADDSGTIGDQEAVIGSGSSEDQMQDSVSENMEGETLDSALAENNTDTNSESAGLQETTYFDPAGNPEGADDSGTIGDQEAVTGSGSADDQMQDSVSGNVEGETLDSALAGNNTDTANQSVESGGDADVAPEDDTVLPDTTDDAVTGAASLEEDSNGLFEEVLAAADDGNTLASGDYSYEVRDGSAVITGYTGNGTDVVIPNTLGNYTVSAVGEGAFKANTTIASVTIPATVTALQYESFSSCSNLQTVTIASGSGLKVIGKGAFLGTGLTGIILPDSVETIEEQAFVNCTSLESITLNNGLKTIGKWAFIRAGVKSITLPDSLESMGDDCFYSCSQLESVTLGRGLSEIPMMCFAYTGLTAITFPENITVIGFGAFQGTKIEELSIGNNITEIGGWAFRNNTSLKTLYLGKSVTSIQYKAFCDCTNLTDIQFPGSLERLEGMEFHSASVYGIENSTAWYSNQPNGSVYIDKVYYYYKGVAAEGESVTIKEGTRGIAGYAFEDQKNLSEVVIPDSVTNIGECAFSGCSGIHRIYIPSSVKEISEYALGYDQAWRYGNKYRIDDFTIIGEEGSAAQKYASDNNIPFEIYKKQEPHVHSWSEWTVTKPATELEAGMETRTCSCGEKETREIPKLPETEEVHTHSWSEWIIKTPASVFEKGEDIRTCSCGETETREIEKLKPTISLNFSGTLPLKVKQKFNGIMVSDLAYGDYVKNVVSANRKIVKASLDDDGFVVLKAKKKGRVKVAITLKSGLQKTFSVKVSEKAVKTKSLSVGSTMISLDVKDRYTIIPVVKPISTLDVVTYKSSNKKIAAVTKKGVIKAKRAGKCKITVRCGKKKKTIKVTVN